MAVLTTAPHSMAASGWRSWTASIALVALGLGVGLPGPLAAASPVARRVVLMPVCDDDAAAATVASLARQRLLEAGWDAGYVQGSGKLNCWPIDLTAETAAVKRAIDLFHALKLPAAHKRLERVIARLAELPLTEPPEVLREAHLYLGWIEIERGNEAGAKEPFGIVRRLWPSWLPDRNRYAPQVVDTFLKLARVLDKSSPGALEVITKPPGASATLDGRMMCTSPCRIGEAIPGEHFLRIAAPGYAPETLRVDVSAGQSTLVNVSLIPDSRLALTVLLEAGQIADLGSLPQDWDAEVVVVLWRRKPSEPLAAIVARQRVESHALGNEPALAAAELVDLVAGQAVVNGALPSAAVVARPGGDRRWWLWSAAAAAGLLVTGSVAYAVWSSTDKVVVRIRP